MSHEGKRKLGYVSIDTPRGIKSAGCHTCELSTLEKSFKQKNMKPQSFKVGNDHYSWILCISIASEPRQGLRPGDEYQWQLLLCVNYKCVSVFV